MAQRSLFRLWRNGKGGQWTIRLRWFEGMDPDNIRLNMEDRETERNFFPDDKEHAERIWKLFRETAPKAPNQDPFVFHFIHHVIPGIEK